MQQTAAELPQDFSIHLEEDNLLYFR